MRQERIHEPEISFEEAHLGRGWAFPPTWSDARGPARDGCEAVGASRRVGVGMVAGLEDIQQSIRLVLETTLGERVMQPAYGSDVHRHVFASIDPQSKADLGRSVRRALLLWERRIRDVDVQVSEHQGEVGRLDVEISFFVDTHRMRQSFIFPFYVNQPEGL